MNNKIGLALLKDEGALEEISRYKWIESEKAGYDIGFEKASREWLARYAKDWIKYHRKPRGLFMAKVLEKAKQLNHLQFDVLFKN